VTRAGTKAGVLASPDRAELIARFTSAGQPFELVEQTVSGVPMRVYSSGPKTVREVVLASEGFGDRTFNVYRDERWSYVENARIVAGLARQLVDEYGLRKGDRVAVAMRNYPEWVPIFCASAVLGVVLVPLNAWWTAPELQYALADADVRLVVADAERAALLGPHLDESGRPPLIEVRGGRTPAARPWEDLRACLDLSATVPDVKVVPDDIATILYTSGTTGKPKGAISTHRNHCTNFRNAQLAALVSATLANGGELPPPDFDAPQPGLLVTFPLFHMAAIGSLGGTILTGSKFVTQYKWDRTEARHLIAREQLTGVSGVPTVIRQLLDDVATYPDDFATLAGFGAGGAPVPPDLVAKSSRLRDAALSPANGYGSTETTSAVVTNAGDDYRARPDSVGRCLPGTDIRVVDPDTGKDVEAGGIGELWFRGPNIFRGYWNNPDATAAALIDGWFRTGDIGRVDDGWVYVLDRLKDVIIRGGENIYCAEVEAALYEHPAIEDATVVGIPHPSLGEQAVAVVVPRVGMSLTATDVQQHVASRLASFKVPAHVVFQSDPLPRNASGKVLKRDLRDLLADKLIEDAGE
jgi:long-chain acyl-CoA synthetase